MAEGSIGGVRRGSTRRAAASLRERLASSLWPIPMAAIFTAVVLGILLPQLDQAVDDQLPAALRVVLFAGGVDSARAVLSVIAGSLISATSLTFSLTVIALQLASSQASPRVLRTFSKDSVLQWTLAVFVGTFAYALTVLHSVQDSTATEDEHVPRIAVTVGSLLTLASVVMLTLFLAHLVHKLRLETTMKEVHAETSSTMALVSRTSEGVASIPSGFRPASTHLALARDSGFIRGADRSQLLSLAVREDIVIEEESAAGHDMVEGTPVARWWPRDERRRPSPDESESIGSEIASAFALDYERTPSQDLEFGIRQLVDIVIKAMSPGINDPTTAVHALGHISAILGDIAILPEQPAALADNDDVMRVVIRTHDFDKLLETAMEQPRRYGAGDPDVAARLFQLVREVAYRTSDARHRVALERQLARLEKTVASVDYDDVEVTRFAQHSAACRAALAGEWVLARP